MPRAFHQSNSLDKFDTPRGPRPKDHPPNGTRTGTACPACLKEQMWCPSGVVCSDYENCDGDKSEGHGSPSDIPFGDPREPVEETLDEVLAGPSAKSNKPRRQAATIPQTDFATGEISMGSLSGIVEQVFDFDFDATFAEVEAFLAPGDDRRLDFGRLQLELDQACDKAAKAHRLYTNAREAREIFEIDKQMILAPMRTAARYAIECEIKSGDRTKSITDADILGMMASQDPRKWRHLRVTSIRMEATVDHTERLSDLARKRIDVLKTLVEKK